jgi:hypothetical protein
MELYVTFAEPDDMTGQPANVSPREQLPPANASPQLLRSSLTDARKMLSETQEVEVWMNASRLSC